MENSLTKKAMKKRSLSDWIIDFDQKFLGNPELSEENKEIIMNSYTKSSNLRNTFHNNFLSTIYHNLDCPSSREVYNYEYFFKINGPNNFENTDENSHLVKTKSSSDFNKQKDMKTKNENQTENINKNEQIISFEIENDGIIEVKDNESEENIEANEKEINISIIDENDEMEENHGNKAINEKIENVNINEKKVEIFENKEIGYR